MGSFGETVGVLLNTYTECLRLLKKLGPGTKASAAQSKLGGSIRSNRAEVRRVYSSGLSSRGSYFEDGDAAARSSMRRVIRKLRASLASLKRTFARQPVDYDSVEFLFSTSRLEAISTMGDLSSRVASQITLQSVSSRSSRQNGKDRNPRSKRHRHASHSRQGGRTGRSPSKIAVDTRTRIRPLSMATTSSESTKLGEIRRRHGSDLVPHLVAYPLYVDSRGSTRDGDDEKKKKKKNKNKQKSSRKGWFGFLKPSHLLMKEQR
ncbi:hypothetical protein S7711_08707 [Stachybotrys chartarum IBT 7711]|uniref:Uncharacterized protein n=1 Tax=Stachybotrys chartarum (strain CBS 109288 / IBT 7711) TaxID=1280523 RepID=A0A084AKD9_STACB|nr:hypothetical protein S7711_08707 [Stachybotrys chartarum IBT 7711]